MRHEDYKELLALEAAGALDADERRVLEEHLPSCAECLAELRELSDAAAALAYAATPVAPPAALRARVLERIRAVDPSEMVVDPSEMAVDPSEMAVSAREAGDAKREKGAVAAVSEDLRGLLSRLSLWQLFNARPSLGFGAAFAAAAVVVLCAATFTLWSRTESLRTEVARLSSRLDESQRELAGQREQLARAQDVNDIISSPAATVAQLAGKTPAPQARAVLAYDGTTGRAVLLARGLPPAPEGKAYQLWLIADNKPLPGATFKSDAEGRARLSDQLPAGVKSPTFAVTLEREGGETAPKGDMYLLGSSS